MSEKKLTISVAKIVHLTIFGVEVGPSLKAWDWYIMPSLYQIPE